jgi:D-sedoheptulose 7-phosphate isomerase
MRPLEDLSPLDRHLAGVAAALLPYRAVAGRLARWGGQLAWTLGQGGRLLVAGNGGSAAEAQHLAAELVGRLRDERAPLSAVALTADSSAVTAISNDYGFEQMFARQVHAHGRPDDILIVLSTSGRSANLLAAVEAAREIGMRSWALTGPGPNPLGDLTDEAVCCPSDDSQIVQELHLVSVHLLCEYVDRTLPGVLGSQVAPHTQAPRVPRGADGAAAGQLVTVGTTHVGTGAHPAGVVPAGTHPAGTHPSGAHPNGSPPNGGHQKGAHPNGTRPNGANGSGSRP